MVIRTFVRAAGAGGFDVVMSLNPRSGREVCVAVMPQRVSMGYVRRRKARGVNWRHQFARARKMTLLLAQRKIANLPRNPAGKAARVPQDNRARRAGRNTAARVRCCRPEADNLGRKAAALRLHRDVAFSPGAVHAGGRANGQADQADVQSVLPALILARRELLHAAALPARSVPELRSARVRPDRALLDRCKHRTR